MSARTNQLSDELHRYIVQTTVRESEHLARVRAETAPLPGAGMQTSPEQGQLLALLVELLDARAVLEVGVFTGYSALALAEAVGPRGRVVACELDPDYAERAREAFDRAGVLERVEIHVGPAAATLERLASAQADTFDLAYIDADKTGYDTYYEQSLRLLRRGGLVALDNMLWGGSVADPANRRPDTEAIRALNEKIGRDPRVTPSLIPIGDGLLLARKR